MSSYGNIESSPWRVIGEDRAAAIAEFYSLDPDRRAKLMAAWAATPLTKYASDRKEQWRKQNARRSAAKRVPVLVSAVLELLAFVVAYVPDAELCRCGIDGKLEDSTRSCEICEALAAIGLPAFSSRNQLMADVAKLADKLEAARAAKV